MKKQHLLFVIGFVIVAVSGFIVWRILPAFQSEPSNDTRLMVGATIFPLADIARHVGGEDVYVLQIIPSGITEHSSEVSPQVIEQLARAKVLFTIGHGLDTNLSTRAQGALPSLSVVTVDKGISLKEFAIADAHEEEAGQHFDSGVDPHYWLTVPNAMQMAATVAHELSIRDPDHAAGYAARLQEYTKNLAQLEKKLQSQASQIPKKEFVAMHNAWGYFAQHYGLKLLATYEPLEGQEPSLNDLQNLRNLFRQHGITTFFVEPQKFSPSIAAFIEREFGLRVLTLDPVGGSGDASSYADLMQFNMNALVAGADN